MSRYSVIVVSLFDNLKLYDLYIIINSDRVLRNSVCFHSRMHFSSRASVQNRHLTFTLMLLAWAVPPGSATITTLDAQCSMVGVDNFESPSSVPSGEEPVVTDVKVTSGLNECVLLCCMEGKNKLSQVTGRTNLTYTML